MCDSKIRSSRNALGYRSLDGWCSWVLARDSRRMDDCFGVRITSMSIRSTTSHKPRYAYRLVLWESQQQLPIWLVIRNNHHQNWNEYTKIKERKKKVRRVEIILINNRFSSRYALSMCATYITIIIVFSSFFFQFFSLYFTVLANKTSDYFVMRLLFDTLCRFVGFFFNEENSSIEHSWTIECGIKTKTNSN